MLRYLGTDVTTAGLLVGAATIVGGIGGTTLGAKVAEHYLRRVKSAFFLIPALFTLPAAALLLVALNVTTSVALTGALLILSQIMFWTATAPISGSISSTHLNATCLFYSIPSYPTQIMLQSYIFPLSTHRSTCVHFNNSTLQILTHPIHQLIDDHYILFLLHDKCDHVSPHYECRAPSPTRSILRGAHTRAGQSVSQLVMYSYLSLSLTYGFFVYSC